MYFLVLTLVVVAFFRRNWKFAYLRYTGELGLDIVPGGVYPPGPVLLNHGATAAR